MTGTANSSRMPPPFYVARTGGHGEMHMSGQSKFDATTTISNLPMRNAGTSPSGIVTMTISPHQQIGATSSSRQCNSSSATLTMDDDSRHSFNRAARSASATMAANRHPHFERQRLLFNTGPQGTQSGPAAPPPTGSLNLNGGVYKTTYLRGSGV